jgi:hypothetical protein
MVQAIGVSNLPFESISMDSFALIFEVDEVESKYKKLHLSQNQRFEKIGE